MDESPGQGTDTLSFASITTAISVNLSDTAAQLVHTDRSILISSGTGIENVTGGSGDDVIYGNGQANELRGNGGHDLLVGLSGNDVLNGGDGFDVLVGGQNADTLQDGSGEDLLIAGFTRTIAGLDDDRAFLQNVQVQWTAPAVFNDRVQSLTPMLVSGLTVLNDSAVDTLSSAADGSLDLLFAALADGVTKDAGDLLTLL